MFKHILVTAANKENSEIIAESYFQVNLFGKQLKLFKRRTKLTVKPKDDTDIPIRPEVSE